MAIEIQKISIQGLGPIQKLNADLGKLNLFYGWNEKGKTLIVEFIIRSLFRKNNNWKLRDLSGNGRITLTGIDKNTSYFSPSSEKIEDLLNSQETELPADFSKLLVVKGADLALASQPGGIDKKTLKGFLSSLSLFDHIDNRNISETIKKSSLENNKVQGPKMGEIKRKDELFEQLEKIDRLFDQLARGYAGGQRKILEIQKERLNQEKENLMKAKYFQAFQLSKEIREIGIKVSELDVQTLESIKKNIQTYQIHQSQMKQLLQDQKVIESKIQYFSWLKKALEIYRNQLRDLPQKPAFIWMLLPILCMTALGVFILLQAMWPSIIALCALLGTCGFYVYLFNRYLSHKKENEELTTMKSEFEKKFHIAFTGLVQIESLYETMENDEKECQSFQKQIDRIREEVNQTKIQINQKWLSLTGKTISESDWTTVLRENEDGLKLVNQKLHEKEVLLAGLNVSSSDYIQENPGLSFSHDRLESISKQLEDVKREIESAFEKLNTLKQMICNETGDTIDQSWEALIEHLQKRRAELLFDYQDVMSGIVGKLAVHRVIERMRTAEDKKIAEGLVSPEMSEPLKKMTNRYHQLRLQNDEIIVLDDVHEFKLRDLSTGAQEQVLLALRLGFASKLMAKNRFFLILDDAFQHSDWTKRPLMIDTLIELARDNWQILYFTMDDHIRDLFQEKGKSLGKDFVSINLN